MQIQRMRYDLRRHNHTYVFFFKGRDDMHGCGEAEAAGDTAAADASAIDPHQKGAVFGLGGHAEIAPCQVLQAQYFPNPTTLNTAID